MTVQELLVNLQALHTRAVHAVAALDDARMHREARISGDLEHARDDVFDVGREAAADWLGEMVDAVARLVAPPAAPSQRAFPATAADLDAYMWQVVLAHARVCARGRDMSMACLRGAGPADLAPLCPLYAEALAEARAAEAALFAAVTGAAAAQVVA